MATATIQIEDIDDNSINVKLSTGGEGFDDESTAHIVAMELVEALLAIDNPINYTH